ncbi:MAG: hypothetical protein ABEJ81_07030 [Haloferacaceae archaeon]
MTDGDRLLDVGGLVLGLTILAMIGVLAMAFVEAPGGGATAGPNAEWSVSRVNDTHVRITHAGGEAVEIDRLVVTVDGYERRASWSGTIREGDAGVVRAGHDLRLRLYWVTDRGERVRLDGWRT